MECPKCKVPSPEGAAECPACGLIFAKWQAHQAVQAGAVPATTTAPAGGATPRLPSLLEPVPETSDAWVRIGFIAILVAAAGLAAYFLLKPGAPKVQAPRVTPWGVLGGKPAAAFPTEPLPPTPVPKPTVLWRFEGKVFDILHQTPVEGVTVSFDIQPPVVVLTDASGSYGAEVPVAEDSQGVYIWVNHPDFGNSYWAGDHTKRPYEERIRMYGVVQFQGSTKGSVDKVTRMDFSMFPSKLTEEERTKIHDTLYPPARD